MAFVTLLLQVVLYAFGPFFCYPWKPVINALAGDKYGPAYKHFRRDHSHPVNLFLHAVCMVFQLVGNFQLLDAIDNSSLLQPIAQLSGASRPLSLLTLISWCACLVFAPSPLLVTSLSIASLFAAYYTSPLLTGPVLEYAITSVFSVALALGLFFCPPRTKVLSSKINVKVFVVALIWLLWPYGWNQLDRSYGGLLASLGYVNLANVGLAVFLFACSASPFVPEAPAIGGALICRLLSILTGQPMLFLLGSAFTASLLQGTAHKLTGEVATLINHNRPGAHHSPEVKVRLEWAHVTFFPSLALHSVCQSLGLI